MSTPKRRLIIFNPARVSDDGILLSDPQFALQDTVITNDMGADGYTWSQANPILIDQYGCMITSGQIDSGSHNIIYSNNPNHVTPSWYDNSGYADETALTRGSIALDTTNDVLHVLWVGSATDGIIYRRYTINRDGNNLITSITKDGTVNLQLDYETSGTMLYEHPIMLWGNDGGSDGTYGKLVAIWSARNTDGGTGNEIRSSMCVLGNTANQGATSGNWTYPVASDTTGIGNAPQVTYSILASGTSSSSMYPSALRTTATNAKDIYLFYADGASTVLWRWRRLRWNNGANDWSTGLTSITTICQINRTGTDTGYSLKDQLGSHPVEDTSNHRVYFGFANWKNNTDGDTWSYVYVNSSDVLSSIVDVYSSGGAHSYAPCGDIAFDATSIRLVVSYIKTTTQACYIQVYNGTTVVQEETLVFDTQPVDIPLIGQTTRLATGVMPFLFRDTQATHLGWYGTMLWPNGVRDTSTPPVPPIPSDIAGLLFWFKTPISGATDNNSIASWPDSSGNGRDVTPSGAGLVYRTNIINGLAIVEQTGSTDATFSSTNLGTAHTVFIVIRPIAGFGDGVIIGGNALGKYTPYIDGTDIYYRAVGSEAFVTVANGGLSSNTSYLFEIVRNGTSVDFYKNGSQLSTTQTLAANTALAVVEIASISAAVPATNMQFAEIFVFDSALSLSDRQDMEDYISTRYGFF